jgi:hypothetical protein
MVWSSILRIRITPRDLPCGHRVPAGADLRSPPALHAGPPSRILQFPVRQGQNERAPSERHQLAEGKDVCPRENRLTRPVKPGAQFLDIG